MKQLAGILALVALPACVVHLHVHEAPHPAPAPAVATTEASAPAAQSTESSTEPAATGVVVDDSGRPLRARIAAVGVSGSVANATDEQGRFAIDTVYWPEFTLVASTDDDLVAVAPRVATGSKDVRLVARPAAAVTIRLEGDDATRCALFLGGARVEDFTLRLGKPARVVVPPGDVHVRLYDGEEIRAERDVHLNVGEHKEIELVVQARKG